MMGQAAVGWVTGDCPPVFLSTQDATYVSGKLFNWDAQSGDGLWLDDEQVAFLAGSRELEVRAVFVADLVQNQTIAIKVDDVPVGLSCVDGRLFYESESGRRAAVSDLTCAAKK
jgi:hypothetical protein